ncbi:MAG: hypothetical protein J0I69_13955 [Altererythrobacter sp.]|nr:hypothetical protein [Altererythrobacter sp.]OJU59098.1 MAG: hypothetical protein BGO08_05380 [Altererythrobacter sp. 66-12]
MRRSLVLTDETARHPFRASLPPHVCALAADDLEPHVPWRERIYADVRGFAQAYCACFVAVAVFIS